MGTTDLSLPRPTGGVIHDNVRHTANFTVVGNHLAQHPELSLLAIGLGLHIQSLPAGRHVDIKTLTARFKEGATRIAAALRELETHGYLRRERERTPRGRIVTRTISCNNPAAAAARRHHRPAPRNRKPKQHALPAVRRPAALLAHRLTALLPPPPPFRAPAAPPPVVHPLRNCDGCDRSIRAAEPGTRCRDCRTTAQH
ncbi:hypothetical protein SUDANB145_03217 [Streptomyces sp. enrichment culture]|uniref:hypothetical protein n=1 Tax=Streptomyces sp. enrichment culture TaxID=1795815 RepID=UPI003F546AD1